MRKASDFVALAEAQRAREKAPRRHKYVRIDGVRPAVVAAVDAIAAGEGRCRSMVYRRLIAEALRARGVQMPDDVTITFTIDRDLAESLGAGMRTATTLMRAIIPAAIPDHEPERLDRLCKVFEDIAAQCPESDDV